MNFDKESKSEEIFYFIYLFFFIFFIIIIFFFFGGGGKREREEEGDFNRKKNTHTKNNWYSLIFCAHALYKISSSWLKWFSSFNTNNRSTIQVRAITLPMFYGIQSKVILTWILSNLLNFRILAKAILYILCWQGFSILIKANSKKGHNSINVLQNSLKSKSGHPNNDPKTVGGDRVVRWYWVNFQCRGVLQFEWQ